MMGIHFLPSHWLQCCMAIFYLADELQYVVTSEMITASVVVVGFPFLFLIQLGKPAEFYLFPVSVPFNYLPMLCLVCYS